MKIADTLIDYVKANPPFSEEEKAESILEMLFLVYTQRNVQDDEAIRGDFEKLYSAMNGKPLKEVDAVIDPVCSLCTDHLKSGFIHGVQVGVGLAIETELIR